MSEVKIGSISFKTPNDSRDDIIISILEKARKNFESRFNNLVNVCRYIVYIDSEFRLYEHKEDREATEVANALGDQVHDENLLSFFDKEIEISFTANG